MKLEDIRLRVIVLGRHDWERSVTRYMLIKVGFHVREACDDAEAISRHRELPCDALVLHVDRTLGDVARAAREIQAQSPSVKVISLVDHPAEPQTIDFLLEQVGEHPILVKPFAVDSFWRLILALPYELKLRGDRECSPGSVGSRSADTEAES